MMYLYRKYFHRGLWKEFFGIDNYMLLLLILLPFGLLGQGAVTNNPVNSAFTIPVITGPSIVCTGSQGNVYSTEPGMTGYSWSVSAGGTITGGDGTAAITVTWGVAGNETVSVTYATATAPGTLDVTVLPVLPVGVSISASQNPVCAGASVTFTANPVNGGANPLFQWKVNGINVGVNNSTFVYSPSNGDVVGCQLTSGAACTSGNPANAIPVTMTVNPNLQVSLTISASANPICQGANVTFTALAFNGGLSPAFLWKVNGINTGTNSSTFQFAPVNGDIVTCQLTSSAQCNTGNPATSNPVTMSVSPSQPVGISVTASSNPSCQGNLVTFSATTVNAGTSPVFLWKVNGVATGGNSPAFQYLPANGDQVTCELTSNASCAAGNPAVSNQLTMTVSPTLPAEVSIVPSANPVCQGSAVEFTAFPVNGGSLPTYQWFINGFNVGTNSATYSVIPANGDVVKCQMTSALACVSANPATSNLVTLTVNPSVPVNVTIAGSANPVCSGTAVIYTATPYNGGTSPAYQWKVNGINTGLNSAQFSYTPLNGDVVTCQLTSNENCASGNNALSNAIVMTVSINQPVGVTINTPTTDLCQGMTADFTANPVNGGSSPVFQWKVNGSNAGTNSPIFSYIPGDGDVVSCQLTSSAICTSGNPALSNSIVLSVNAGQTFPVSVAIGATSNPSCLGNQVTYTASPVNGGTTPVFQWLVNGLDVGTNSPSFSYIPSNGDFVKCQLTSSYLCATGNPAMSNEISMTVNPFMAPAISIVTSANPSCQGTSVTFTANPVNGGSSPVYQWKVNGSNTGLNQSTFIYTPATGDIISCQMTSSVPCPVTNPVNSNSITMTVLPVQAVSVSITTLTNPSCSNTQVIFNAIPSNGGSSPAYQWKVNGGNVGLNNPTFIYIPVAGEVVTCQMVSNTQCYTGNKTVISNPILMSVASELPASVSIAASANPFCQGASVAFVATPTNGGNTPVFQWKVNCVAVGTNNPVLNYVPQQGDFVTCQMTSSLSCAVLNPAISNGINMSVNTGTPASISILASGNPVCQGATVSYSATAVNGGMSPIYQWKVNGTNVGTNAPAYSHIPANGDVVTCRLTSNAGCVSGSPVTSAPVTMNVSSALPASLTIATKTNPFCQGTSVLFNAMPINGGTSPIYQWQVNGINSGAPSVSPVFSYIPATGDVVSCQLTSNATCLSGANPVSSNQITLTSAALLSAGISIAASANPVCGGTSVTYTAVPVNGGVNPVYQWYVNGTPNGSNNDSLVYNPMNGDVVTCQLTSSLSCATSNPILSNAITMVVNPALPVSVTIAASINPCCSGTQVTFTATGTNGGTSPSYQWKVNCQNVGTNGPTYTYTPVSGDVIVCIMTSNALCCTGSPAISNNVNMVVLPLLPVSVSISTPVNPFCIGTSVTFTADPLNAGTIPVFQWKVNGIGTGFNLPTFTYQPSNGDIVTCELTSNLNCVSGNPAVSNALIMVGTTGLPVSVSIVSDFASTNNTICQGTTVVYTATPSNGGAAPAYQWKVNGANYGSQNNILFEYQPVNGDVITCQLTSSLNCASNNPAISNPITMTVNPIMQLSVIASASANPTCEGNSVLFTTAVTNGGTNPTYRWFKNGANTGVLTPTYSYAPLNNDVVYCRVSSSELCKSNSPGNSNSILMIVNPNASATVSIAASANPVCQGIPVTFTASPFNGGTLPVYQWKVNGVNAGSNSPTYIYSPINGDVITCEMTSNSPCTPVTVVTSGQIIMNVSPVQPVSVSISASANPTCIASVVNYVATGLNGGSSPVYQWKVNGVISGSNSPNLSYMPVNGDLVTCKFTSTAACSTGNPANSNTIMMTVSESLPVEVSIAASINPSCQGQVVDYTATPVNGSASPVYQWRVNGIDVGSNNPQFSYAPSNSDFITCQLTSGFSCGTGNPASSNQVNALVRPYLPAGVYINSSANPVCEGTAVIFSASAINGGSAPAYQWRVNGLNVGSNLAFYSYVPLNGDVVDCQMTSSEVCPLNNPVVSTPITMTVLQPANAAITITPSINPVCPGMPVTFSTMITNGGSAPSFQWYVNGNLVSTNFQSYTYAPVNGDAVVCQMISNGNCVVSPVVVSNQVVMEVNSNLTVGVSITASANPVCLGQQVTYTAISSNGGALPVYQWMVNGLNVGTNSPVLNFIPTNGDVVSCQLLSDLSCAFGNPAASNNIIMIVEQSDPVSISISVSSNPICLGSPATFSAIPVNAGVTPQYQWHVNGNNAGTSMPEFIYIPANGDIVTCEVISNNTCSTGSTAISDPVIMIGSTDLPVNVTISASSNPVCSGIPVTFSTTIANGGDSPVYQWKVNGVNVGLSAPGYTYIPADGDLVSCMLMSDLPCATGNPASSNTVQMGVYTGQVAAVSIVSEPAGIVCEGSMVTCTAIPVNGGGPSFQWYRNGMPVGLNQSSYSFIPLNGDVVHVVMTSALLCVSGNPATSDPVILEVAPAPISGVSITADQNNICQGTAVMFTAVATNGGSPDYQWYVNGFAVGSNQPTFTYTPVNGDQVMAVMTSSLACVSGSPSNSNIISMSVIPTVQADVFIVADQVSVCEGGTITFTATPSNAGTPQFQWYRNNLPVGGNSPIYSYIPSSGDQVYVTMTSSLLCVSVNPVASNTISVTVNPVLPAGVSVSSDLNNICEGTSVTVTAIPVNGGTPDYQWFKNNVVVGFNQPTYSFSPADGDQVYVIMTSDQACVTGNPVTSNIVTLEVNNLLPASVTISSDQNNICEGTAVTLTAVPQNSGSPVYQWFKNGLPVGLDQPSYSFVPVNSDQVYVVMTSSLECVSGNPANSNTVVMTVNPALNAGVVTSPNQNNVCEGVPVTFTAVATNGGTPVYQWFKNGAPVGLNQDTYTITPVDGDQVYVVMTSNLSCVLGSPVTSNLIVMVVNPVVTTGVTIVADLNNVCAGTPVTVTATPDNGGSPVYQWFKNSLPVGLNQPFYTFIPSDGDQVYVTMTSSLTCVSGSPVVSNNIVLTVVPVLPATVNIVPDQNNVCPGTSVTITANPANGGTPAYQWYKNGLPAGLNQSTYTFLPLNSDQVYVVMTSSLACVSGNPATSGTVNMVVNPVLNAGVAVTPSQNNVCEGVQVTFTAAATNGGSPVYQWFKNGVPVGLNQSTYTITPVDGDQVYVVMTSNLPCIQGSPVTSNLVVMVVNPVVPAGVSIVSDQNNVCSGTTVTVTATPVNGGVPVFQWFKNGSPVGLNQPVYSFVPTNGDQVYVTMTSSLSCVSGSPAVSNSITMTVLPSLPVGVSIDPDLNNICEGTSVTFTASPTNGGSPTFQWYQNGLPVGLNLPTYSSVPGDGDQVYVIMTSTLTCATGNPATSNTVVMEVNPILPVGVSIVEDQNNICAGETVVFTATPTNGGTPAYQWYLNNLPVGLNQPTYTCIPSDDNVVYVTITSTLACTTGNPATSNNVIMEVNPLLPVSVTISLDQNNVCEGTPVTCTALPVNGGNPDYQWYVNNQPVGLNQDTYTFTPSNGDVVFVGITSTLTCISGSPATSNAVSLIVNPLLQVNVTMTPGSSSVCDGTPVTYSATVVNGGTPAFQWYQNGLLLVGENQSTYTCIPSDGDQVYVVAVSSASCVTGNPATSNTVVMDVNPFLPVNVSIMADQVDVCAGMPVVFTATPVNGGAPFYQWYLNNSPAGLGQSNFTLIPSNGDQVSVVMTSSEMCGTGNPAQSNSISLSVHSYPGNPAEISGPSDVCAGADSVVYSVAQIPDALSYLWNLPDGVTIVSGEETASIIVNFANDAVEGNISVLGVNTCGNGPVSAAVPVSIHPLPETPVVTIAWPVLQSSVLEGNQWYYEGNIIPDANGSTFDVLVPGWYWTVVTSQGCGSDTSNHVYVNKTNPDEPGILVYPVPNDGHFTVSIILSAPDTFNISVYDFLGRKLYEVSDLLVNNKYKEVFDLRPLPKGVYSVVFNCKDYQVVKKILINKK